MPTKTTPTSSINEDQSAKPNRNTMFDQSKLSNQSDNDSTETKGNPPTERAVSSSVSMPSRLSIKQKKATLEEYRNLFLETPKITDRKTVFISGTLRDLLDEIARKLGDRKMSVSGLLENMARHHLQTYEEDLEMWKKL